jgi:Tol biopolymer transport system component
VTKSLLSGNRRQLLWAAAGITGVAAAVAGSSVWWHSARRSRPPAGVLLKEGLIRDAVFSPDGEEVVFSWQRPGGQGSQIYSISLSSFDPSGGKRVDPRPLTFGPGQDFDPVFSPDGSKICFIRRGKGESAIYVIDRSSGVVTRRVASIQYDSTWGARLGWFGPSRIAVTDQPGTPGYRLIEVDVDSGAKRRWNSGDEGRGDGPARLSPDGTEVLFARAFGMNASDLFIRPAAGGGEERRITFDQKPKAQYRWSRDGRTIVYRAPKPVWKLWEVGRDGKGDREAPVPHASWGSFDIRSAGDGKRELILAQLPDNFSIWKAVRKPDGSFAPPQMFISAASGAMDSGPVISPDGRRIAFLSTRTGNLEIWVADADGNNPVQVTRLGSQQVAAPSWSPDSRRILSAARLTDIPQAFLIDAQADAKLERIPHVERYINEPQFAPPGDRIMSYCGTINGRAELFRIPIGGGSDSRPEQLTRNGCTVYRYSPDGRWIYFVRANEISGLHRIPSSGAGPEELVLPEVSSQLYRAWAVARSGIYYIVEVEGGGGRWEVRHYDPVQKVRKVVLPVPHPLPRWSGTLSVSPDESWMAFPQQEPVVGELVFDPDWK